MNKHQMMIPFSLGAEKKRASAGQDGRACFARSCSRGRTGTGQVYFTSSADNKKDWQPCPGDAEPAGNDD